MNPVDPKPPPATAFRVEGMDCAEEVAILKRELAPLVGGEEALAFDVLQRKLVITPHVADVRPAAIVEAINQTGMRAELWSDDRATTEEATFWQRRGRTVLTTASGGMLAAGWGAQTAALGLGGELSWSAGDAQTVLAWTARVLYSAAIVSGGWHVAPKAFYALRRLRPDMNLLMVAAVLGAVVLGEWLEAATVTFLFAVSLALEAWSVGRARRAVAALMNLSPTTVRLVGHDGEDKSVRPEDVPTGALFLVKPGERIALDGRVTEGASEVNQAPITGESVPVSKEPGAEVFAGTINGDGALTIESTKPAADTTLARIIRLVDEAQARRSPSEQWVERFARIYTPTIFAAAVMFMVLPPLVMGGAWSDWFYRSLVLLVIACPCALVISTPVVVIGNESHVCGFIALADTVRPAAKTAIAALRKLGIQHIIMLTGDNRGTGEAIGRETGVDEVLAELLPADKVSRVEELVNRFGTVAMVGDGVNDAPALGRATLGIAMGAAGTDAAIETADVALMSDELSKLPWLVAHSRRTLAVIQQNIIFSLTVKAIFAVLTLAGFASLWGAIAADTGASLLVVGNGLRLVQSKPV